uniref:protein ALP1-like n=1 Tax=Erigeron canadensis TaxID=72917 RepID=UPI001CB99AB7|nr:protein ALP1-like [Erigeron canadensis]
MDSDDSSGSSNESADYEERVQNVLLRAAELIRRQIDEQPAPIIRRRVPVDRDRIEAHARLMHDYFAEEPPYPPRLFRRRFRMSKNLFKRIVGDLEARYPYFQTRYDRAGRRGFAGVQKCTSAIRQLTYGVNNDFLDEYLQMSERTSRESCLNFCVGIREFYGARYLRRPTPSDLQRIYDVHEQVVGFPGMIGSIDCMHWPWEMCPAAWRGTYTSGHVGRPSLILQAVASNDLWIWNAYFGQQGSHNDINVFESSPILEEIKGYYLGDGIYPEYATFVKTFSDPIDEKRRHFKKKQESARKGIERAFGVLKKRWKVLKHPALYWDKRNIQDVCYACIILHNMILEDENKAVCQDYNAQEPSLNPDYWRHITPTEVRIQNLHDVKNRETHNMLTADLVDHLWANTPHDFELAADPFADLREYVSTDDDDSD